MRRCDVLIAGAGPAGCAVAMRTARAGLATILLHPRRPRAGWAGESLPAGMGELVRGVFGTTILSEAHHRAAFGTRSVWAGPALVETSFLTNPLGEGWLLDRARLDEDLRHAVRGEGAEIVAAAIGDAVASPQGRGSWQVDLDDGTAVGAAFLVDASGRAGAVLRRLGVRRRAADRQIALLATAPDDGDAYSGTTVEAVAAGWWYTTPLPGHRRVLAYMTDADLWRGRDWQALLAETQHIRRCAGPGTSSARPQAYPAQTARAERIAGETWLAVGDAAMSFDPLSSQGLASGILMGANAGDAIADPDRQGAVAAWAVDYAMLAAEHDDLRAHYARLETRWPESLFWRRRRGADEAHFGHGYMVRPEPA
jgi:flavin-dependent dehydrogenase